MPSFVDSMTDDERWAISYYVLAFSAFTDPLTGDKLPLDRAVRDKLNAADEQPYSAPRLALDPAGDGPRRMARFYKGTLGEGR
jgi:cytochrome c oxidase cbb3-type subunit 2